jgi:Pyruvate/2-oxoacid:ferredoxin oxidoreductase delta subunit
VTKSYEEIPLTPISDSPSTINMTGLWRAFRPVVDISKCKKCTLC